MGRPRVTSTSIHLVDHGTGVLHMGLSESLHLEYVR
jgi:hypothetical protein